MNDATTMLDALLNEHTTLLLATTEGNAPRLVQMPFAVRHGKDAPALLYAVPKDSPADRALRRRTGIAFTIGTPGGAAWLEGTGRAVRVRDETVAAAMLAEVAARMPDADGEKPIPPTHQAVRVVPETMTIGRQDGANVHAQPFTFAEANERWGYPGSDKNVWLRRFAEVTRADVAPVMVMPISIGAALAWRQGAAFRPLPFALTLVGAVAAHLASNVTNDIFDFRSGADERARAMAESGATLDTSSGALTGGALSEMQANGIAAGLWGAAFLCGLGTMRTSGPGIAAFAAAGFALGTLYVAPPLAYGYIGRGLGEAGILASFGLLPVLGSYYAQTGRLAWEPLLAALPPGLFTTDVLFNHHFFHWQSDLAVGKMTPVAVLGEERAGRYSRGVLLAACASVFAGIVARVYSPTALVGLTAAVRTLRKLDDLGAGGKDRPFYGDLMNRTVRGSSRMGLFLLASLVADGLWARLRQRTRSH